MLSFDYDVNVSKFLIYYTNQLYESIKLYKSVHKITFVYRTVNVCHGRYTHRERHL